jgi:hypothetical protein
MNRKTFLKVLGGAAAAIGLGVKAQAKTHAARVLDFMNRMEADPSRELTEKYIGIYIAGVPVYCDPYCPKDSIYIVRTEGENYYMDRDNLEEFEKRLVYASDRQLALVSLISAVKRHGDIPNWALVNPERWASIQQEELHRERYVELNKENSFYGESLAGRVVNVEYAMPEWTKYEQIPR